MPWGLVVAYTYNIGDDMQSLAACQYLPQINCIVDRDFPKVRHCKGQVKAIFNGWYTYNWWSWIPSNNIEPLFTSFHLAPHIAGLFLSNQKTREYLMKHAPIGARDHATLIILRNHGIKAYFSGCLTLTLDYTFSKLKGVLKRDYILVALDTQIMLDAIIRKLKSYLDIVTVNPNHYFPIRFIKVPPVLIKVLKALNNMAVADSVVYLFERPRAKTIPINLKLKRALIVLTIIANARLTITSRLHVALPAIAFNVPALFIHPNLHDPRFSGLLDFVNAFSPHKFLNEVLEKPMSEALWDIPNYETLCELKKRLIYVVKEFVR